jgi:hypothetical protein
VGIKTNRDLKKQKNAKHSDTRLATLAKVQAADKGIEQVSWAGSGGVRGGLVDLTSLLPDMADIRSVVLCI